LQNFAPTGFWVPQEGQMSTAEMLSRAPRTTYLIEVGVGTLDTHSNTHISPSEGWTSGRSGIRTHERLTPLTVFKTVAFVRSAILPRGAYRRTPVHVLVRADRPPSR
jgi:hypothetical protein